MGLLKPRWGWSSCLGRPEISAREATIYSRFVKCELKLWVKWGMSVQEATSNRRTGILDGVLIRLWKESPADEKSR